MKKRRARSQDEKRDRREKLLESAKRHFSIHGYEATTIKMIAGDVPLTPGSFYQYFESKLEIYRTLSLMGMEILERMISESIGGPHGAASDRIRAVAGAYFRFFGEEREFYDIIAVNHLGVREFFADLKLVPVLEERSKNLLSLLASIINRGIASGEFREVDPWKTAVALWGFMDGVLILEVKKSTGFVNIALPDLVEHTIGLVLAGLKK
jgi:AcrR family transcriptional regulator